MAMTETDVVVQTISEHLGDQVSTEQVANVIAALNSVQAGEAVGTVRREPETGKVAHRVKAHGVAQWRVSGPDGEQYNDLQPTLDWDLIYSPNA
ncbi:minor tail protein [Mycobacterium phage BuzzBuzz]|uniref:Uncharacterized protein n=9 Tax=Mycobacterium phage Bxz2 TaxID=205870 RepID=R4JFJ6_BPMB2|nr:hypothetical protein PBI_METHUSELAH_33 [Mycobacterium phage Methuselah]AJA41817.1 hypothetical protein PBI_SPIKE509_34 [Mycobacterium phage Spike509]AJA41908.1 hypothetical protein PBI_PHOXY_34 [Mycobacterium phage Phoxy]ANU79368.1 minor tail protein [Mycobacterium phage BuzzBuzz]AOZ64807.1 hypothetical protein SEA_LOUIE6_34 [Mycobacterium phage Louie6]ASM62452.1 minor tail protein [Mycobacterium phage KADY]AXH47929.1 hypothetical protein SEA_MISOMONSTER_36 [Mycobacterium phage Misomonster